MGYISAAVDRDLVRVWERRGGERITRLYNAPAEFYIEDPRGAHYSLGGKRLRKVTFKSLRDMKVARERYLAERVQMYESDINPAIKILSDKYHGEVGEKINVSFLDIEVDYKVRSYKADDVVRVRHTGKDDEIEITVEQMKALPAGEYEAWEAVNRRWMPVEHAEQQYGGQVGYSSVANPYAPINSVAVYNQWNDRSIVVAVPPPGWDPTQLNQELRELADIHLVSTEAELLTMLIDLIEDADALVGWNSNLFDFPYIGKRVEMVLGKRAFARLSFPDAGPPRWREQEVFGQVNEVLATNGRLLGDYMMLYKKFEFGERESYKLDSIAAIHLPDLPKLQYSGSLADLYTLDFNYFLRYNIRDTEILKGFERVLGYMDLAVFMYRDSTGLFENVTGTVRLADYSVYNYCKYELGVHVKDIENNSDVKVSLRGAHVLSPQQGLHEMVAAVDVRSLYPSAIRSINISPETLIGQFTGLDEDVEDIVLASNKPLTFKDEATGEHITEPASTWHAFLNANNLSISGYGTVFSLQKQGVLPSILERWYNMRVETNEEIDAIEEEIDAICAKYTPITG